MQVNGEEFNINQLRHNNLLTLLQFYNLNPETVAVERNGQILRRTDWSEIILENADRLELIRFVGGG